MSGLRSLAGLVARDALVSTLIAAIAFGPAALPALAGPQDFDAGSSGATINQVDATNWLITAPDGSVIQYSSFDIAATEAVRFLQPDADARVLNRILNALPTRIAGTLEGNGHIYIVNPAGVIFENGAHVDANAIHAAGGNLSNADFANGIDRYTSVTGAITNAAEIRARAVSLVGETVVNSGEIIAEDGWIVIAAGNDVLVGRDDAGGPMLRIEGGAGAIFDAGLTGVTNTGTITATGTTASTGTVRVGAGDLYGTAIFSSSAIRAREIALAAGNRGDIALGGDVSAEKLDISFRGESAAGELRSTVAGSVTTLHTDELKLSATGTPDAQIRVSDVAFRSQDDADDPAVGPNKVTLEQTAALASARLTTLDIGANTAGVARDFALTSAGGNVVVDDKAVVEGSNLALTGALADIVGTDPLRVASLAVTGNARSAGDLVASTGGISVAGNLALTTKPSEAGDPPVETLVSARNGRLLVDGNVTTSAGGGLRIEARDVELGKTIDADPTDAIPPVTTGGAITSRGDVTIGFVDAGGVEQTQTVVTRAIDTRGASQQQGGNVSVAASGDVKLGAITTIGGAGSSSSQPRQDGGSVSLRSTGDSASLEVGAITTGGASAAERGEIEIEAAGTVLLNGGLSATGGVVANADHARDRAVRVSGDEIQLGADALAIAGSDVDLDGAIVGADVVSDTDPPATTARRVDLAIGASGVTTLGSAHLRSLSIASTGTSVELGGDVDADTTVRIGFSGAGTGVISNGGSDVSVRANRVELAASDPSAVDGRAARVDLEDGIDLDLFAIPASDGAAAKAATLVLDQDAGIDSAITTRLAVAAQDTPDLTLELRTHDAVTLDAGARAAVSGTDLVVASRSFSALGATQTASDFDLASLEVTTVDALDVDFGVTAEKLTLAGAGGNLTLRSALRVDDIELVAGDGTSGEASDSRVVLDTGASLRSRSDDGVRPARVALIQDAAFDSADLPDVAIFGGSVAGLEYELQSRVGSVTLSSGSSAKYAGSALELRGQTGVDLGSEVLELASLSAETPAELVVMNQQINATATDGKIRLRAGSDGTGNLEVNSHLAANTIELVAGSGNGINTSARIELQDGARFSAAAGAARPATFVFEQDAAIGPVGTNPAVTALPGLDRFGDDIAGMDYTLRSNGASVRVDDAALVNHSILRLDGDTGVDINADLSVAGLELTGDTTLSGDVASTGDVTVHNRLGLDGAGANEDQSISAGTDGTGNLVATGAITKSGAGAVSLSGRQVTVAAVTTGRVGDSLTIAGVESVSTGALDASGALGSSGGDVTVSVIPGAGSGLVSIASITTRGANGPVSVAEPEDGQDGGAVAVTGSGIAIGNVNTSGGNASAIATSETERSGDGGDAGSITLSAAEVTLNASLDARGGAGAANDPNAVAEHAGDAADVTVHGAIRLGAVASLTGVNVIRGDNVVVDGGVSRAAGREPGQAALAVFAENSLRFGGNLSADRIELEVGNGDLDLAEGGVSEVSANTIRLVATDGNGGNTDSQVVLTGLTLENEAGDAAPQSLSIEQDGSIGAAGSPLPPMGGQDRSVELISHDGAIEIDGPADVAEGTTLTLAANGLADATGPAVRVSGDLDVAGLTIGSVGASGVLVDGDALIDGDLTTGALSSLVGLLEVSGGARITENASFARAGAQTLEIGPGETLTLGGTTVAKSTAGKLTLDADTIVLAAAGPQTIENRQGQLEIGSEHGTGLVKGNFDGSGNPVPGSEPAGLTLRGAAEAGAGPAITVHGTRTQDGDGDPIADGRAHAIAVADGDLILDARVLATGSTTPDEPATWSVAGDVLAYGDVALIGRGVLAGGQDAYAITARRAARTSTSTGGQLRIAGIASSDGDVVLRADGDAPTDAVPNPSAIFLGGDFDLAHSLALLDTTEISADTAITAGGYVVLAADVRGPAGLSIASSGTLFASLDETQTIQAGSLSFGSADSAPPAGEPSLFRDGDLSLNATNGNVEFAAGQRLIVAGDLDVAASQAIVLADTAALTIDLNAPSIQGRGGSNVAANSISFANRPGSFGPGVGTFATPIFDRVSGDVAGANVLLRLISSTGAELSYAGLAAGQFPDVNGPVYFDFATQVPHIGRPASIVRPRADVARLAEAKAARPLWADELLVYLDARSRQAPSAREQGALPPVSAGPNATTPDTAREEADPLVEQAIAPYRALFRPTTEVDPETGIVQGEDRALEIRAAFTRAVEVAATGRGGAAPTAAEISAAIDRDPNLADARAYRADLGLLIAAGNRALDADQRPRFRELLLARVMPSGVSPAEWDALIP